MWLSEGGQERFEGEASMASSKSDSLRHWAHSAQSSVLPNAARPLTAPPPTAALRALDAPCSSDASPTAPGRAVHLHGHSTFQGSNPGTFGARRSSHSGHRPHGELIARARDSTTLLLDVDGVTVC